MGNVTKQAARWLLPCPPRVNTGELPGIHNQLGSLCERVSRRARLRNELARTITPKLRYAGFETLTRSRTIGRLIPAK